MTTDLLNPELAPGASAKSRRAKKTGGLDYLRTRVATELSERWDLNDDDAGGGRVLLLDFDGARPHFGERQVRHHDCLSSPNDDAFAGDGWDGVVIGLQLAWLDLAATVAAAARSLRPAGRLLFCTFGPDTLIQLRDAFAKVDDAPHVHPFLDMHDIGDALLQCGYQNPVVDVDRVTVEYADAKTLFADLRAEGFTNALSDRRKTLTGKARFNSFVGALGAPLSVTFELIYATAAAPSPMQVKVTPPSA